MVLFNVFHLMPWAGFEARHPSWPVPNRLFDPVRGHQLYREYIDQMALADELGFDWVGCNEHHFSGFGLMASPTLIGAALTQRTSRVKIALLGTLLPLSNPVRIAEELAMLDVMSGGRLVAGLLRGTPHEQLAYYTNPDEARGRFEEAVELILKCWTEPEPFGWEGRYYRYRTVSIWPRPLQQPHPRIFMSIGSQASLQFAVKHRAGAGLAFSPLEYTRQQFERYTQLAAEAGWQPPPDAFLYDQFIYVHPTSGAEARRLMAGPTDYFQQRLRGPAVPSVKLVAQLTSYVESAERQSGAGAGGRGGLERLERNPGVEELIEQGQIAVGTPDEVIAQLTRVIRATGLGVFNARFHVGNMPHEQVVDSMRLFVREVLPHVRNVAYESAAAGASPAGASAGTATPVGS